MWWLNLIIHHRLFLSVLVVIVVVCVLCCATNKDKVTSAFDKFNLQLILDETPTDHRRSTTTDQSPSGSGEKRCRDFLRRMTGIEFRRVRPAWLRNPRTGRALELDMFTPTPRPIAFEFDGEQHERYNRFYHSTVRAFEDSQARDRTKDRLCAEHGVELVRIPHQVHDQPEAFVYGHLVRLGLLQPPRPVVVSGAAKA